ncbi:MAG: hypothetical protein FJ209_07880 [Betaproteobacteria bacterium]|nr:hypothetical protein [Betaproteobacteria bacterium]
MATLLGVVGRAMRPGARASRLAREDISFGHPAPRQDDGLQNLARFSHTQEIQVEEIEREVFVREWSQTQVELVTGAAENAQASGPYVVDRRLPNYERRQPMNDRRAGDGHDRRANGKALSRRSAGS